MSLRKEMTLEEYEKVLEEKRKSLLALKYEEMKVNLDKELESLQLQSNKKNDDEVFIKLGSDKDKHKEAVEKAIKEPNHEDLLNPGAAVVLRDNPKMFESNVRRAMAGGYVGHRFFNRCI